MIKSILGFLLILLKNWSGSRVHSVWRWSGWLSLSLLSWTLWSPRPFLTRNYTLLGCLEAPGPVSKVNTGKRPGLLTLGVECVQYSWVWLASFNMVHFGLEGSLCHRNQTGCCLNSRLMSPCNILAHWALQECESQTRLCTFLIECECSGCKKILLRMIRLSHFAINRVLKC